MTDVNPGSTSFLPVKENVSPPPSSSLLPAWNSTVVLKYLPTEIRTNFSLTSLSLEMVLTLG